MKAARATLKRPLFTSGILGSLAIIVGATILVARSAPQESWIVVVFLIFAAALTAVRELLTHHEDAKENEKKHQTALRCPPTAVCDCDPFALGVTPSEIADRFRGEASRPPYVSRDVDTELDRLLRDASFVALVGPSKAGKSRSAFEAISRLFPHRILIAPEMPGFEREGLADAVAAYIDSASEGAVIWLDDLQEYLRAKAVSTHDLNDWEAARQEVVVVATVRDGELASLRDSGLEVERIMDRAKILSLPSLPSTRELKDAETAYPDEDFGDGIGVHLVAGQRLVERLVSGREANPAGYAITCAAIDRRRAGVSSPASSNELMELVQEYWHEVQPRTHLSHEMATQGLAWAAEPVIQDIGLLLHRNAENTLFEPFEYVTAYRDGEVGRGGRAPIPRGTVDALIARHDGWDLRAIAYAAMGRRDTDPAIDALRKLAKDPDPHIAAHGMEDLGRALLYIDEKAEGKLRLEKAAGSNYPCVIAPASFHLALEVVGEDEAKAESLYRQVLDYPQSRVHPKALVNLGLLLRSKTSVEADRNDFGVNFQSIDPSELSLHDLELEKEAREMFEAAINSSDSEARANGGMALGVLLESRGEPELAIEAYKAGTAAGGHQPRIALAQAYAEDRRTLTKARELVEEMEEAEMHPDSIAYRHRVAGTISSRSGAISDEIADLRQMLAVGTSKFSTESLQLRLAIFLIRRKQADDLEEARRYLQLISDSGAGLSPEAKALLSSLEATSTGHPTDSTSSEPSSR